MFLMYSIRVLLARDNKRRDAEPRDDSFDNAHIVKIDDDGNHIEIKVSKVCARSRWEAYYWLMRLHEQEFLDLTDRQNRDFRYVL